MGKRRRTNSCCLSGQQPLPVGLQTASGQQQAEQATQADQAHRFGKWKRYKNRRAELHQSDRRSHHCTLRPFFLTRNPILQPNEWHFIWYATDSVLWSLFNMSLQILIDIVRF